MNYEFYKNSVGEINDWFNHWIDCFPTEHEFRIELLLLARKSSEFESFLRDSLAWSGIVPYHEFPDAPHYNLLFGPKTEDFLTKSELYSQLNLKQGVYANFKVSQPNPSEAFGAFCRQMTMLMGIRNFYLTAREKRLLDQKYFEEFSIKEFSKLKFGNYIDMSDLWEDFKKVRGIKWWAITEAETKYIKLRISDWSKGLRNLLFG